MGRDESRRIRVSEQSGAPLEIPVTTVPSDPDPRSPAAADGASDAVAEVAADGKILHLSPAFARLTGYRPGDALGRNVLEPVHPRDRPEVERIYRQAAREGVPAQLRFRHRHPDGGWRWLEVEVRSRREGGETRVVLVAREAPAPASPGHGLPAQPDAERLVTELSRELLGLEPEDFEEGLQRGLAASARLAGADRVQFYLADRAARGVGGHYQWTAEGFHQRDPGEMGDAIQRFPWSAQELLSGRVVHVPSPSELPPEAGAEREGFARDGVLAYLGLPIRQGERTVGFLDFSRTRPRPGWTATEISRLLLVAEVLSGTVRRLRAERRRRESEERLRLLTSQLQDTICELGTDGSVRYLSPGAEKISGYTREELAQRDPWELVHPEDRESVRRHVAAALAAHAEVPPLTYRIQHREGGWRWLEATVRGFRTHAGEGRLAVVVRDVTERQEGRVHHARQLDLESRIADFSRVLLERSAGEIESGIQQGLELAGQLAGADRAFLVTALGEEGDRARSYDWEAHGTQPRENKLGLPDRSQQQWITSQLLRGDVVAVERVEDLPPEARAVRASLLEAGIRSYLALPIMIEEALVGVVGFHCLRHHRGWTGHELTVLRLMADLFTSALRRKRAELTLRESQSRLLQAQKMEAIGTLAGGIAHDFNNQLTVMLANARFVKAEAARDGEARLALDDLTRAAEHCAQLTRSLLAFSRRSPGSTDVLDAGEAMARAVELLRPLVPSSIRFDAAVEPDLGWIVADATQLQQVLVNLVVNARDAMSSGGKLTLRASKRTLESEEARRMGLSRAGLYVEFLVRDTGSGMEEEVRARIFEPFFTTKPVGQGTGLGLATAYGIVRQCRGTIAVSSVPGRGSTFSVLLPEASQHDGLQTPVDSRVASTGSGTVLLAEDEEAVRRIADRMLRAGGYDVLQARDGAEALRLGREHVANLVALVTDLEMPQLDGLEVARQLTAERPALPVVFISGTAPDVATDPDSPLQRGCFVAKPFSEDELLDAIDAAISGAGSTGPPAASGVVG